MTREPHLPPPRRSVAPIPAAVPNVGPVRPTKLPAVDERTLGNGLRVLAVRTRGIPMVQARLVLPAPRPKATVTDRAKQLVLAETLLSGTQRRGSVEVAEALQRMGGTLQASIDSEDVRLRGSAPCPTVAITQLTRAVGSLDEISQPRLSAPCRRFLRPHRAGCPGSRARR